MRIGWRDGRSEGRDSSHQTVRLAPGRHREPGDGVCVMELSSMLSGERFTDHPKSVCPTIGALLRAYNDSLDPEARQDLYRYASAAVGTRDSYELAEYRARFVLAWTRSRQRPRRGPRVLRWREPRLRDATPAEIADYVVDSLDRRDPAASHLAMLRLLDFIIAMSGDDAPDLAVEDRAKSLLERARQQFAHRPRLEALDERGEEPLDHEPLGDRLGQTMGA